MPVSVAVDSDIFTAHPEYVALIVLADGIGNGPSDDDSSAVLDDAEQHLRARGLTRPADDPHIAAWRAAFSVFGAKPSKYPCSAEALAARVLKGGTLPRVNVLVDLYNAVSVRALTPIGGEDLDHLDGPCASRSPPATSPSTATTALRAPERSSGATTPGSPAGAGTGAKASERG